MKHRLWIIIITHVILTGLYMSLGNPYAKTINPIYGCACLAYISFMIYCIYAEKEIGIMEMIWLVLFIPIAIRMSITAQYGPDVLNDMVILLTAFLYIPFSTAAGMIGQVLRVPSYIIMIILWEVMILIEILKWKKNRRI